jgi:hypothetical protein
MSIDVDVKIIQDLLIIISAGCEKSLEDSINYISAILQVAVDTRCEKILLDERDMQYDLSKEEGVSLTEYIVDHTSDIGRTAIVCKPEDYENLHRWAGELQKQGHDLRYFTDYDLAYQWLDKYEPKPVIF